jgi:hypothetical protein
MQFLDLPLKNLNGLDFGRTNINTYSSKPGYPGYLLILEFTFV